jgi:small-conductance mechanosensitive channel
MLAESTNILEELYSKLPDLIQALIAIATVVVGLRIASWLLLHRKRELNEESRFPRRILMLMLVGVGVVLIILVLPVDDATQSDLLRLLGLLLTAVIALSSTTFVANAMAGFMLRAVRSFRPGDFVSVGEQFGRVTARGLFHTEIQTEDRDLTTLPNLYLISNPITVVRASGTIVSANVSLGYYNSHSQIEPLLVEAAKHTGLKDSFVQITELGDFSVTYRVAGFLPEVKQILTARSNLRAMMLDNLHGAGVEIVSPAFMTQRRIAEQTRTAPPEPQRPLTRTTAAEDNIPEELIFDKAEQAERLEQLKGIRDKLVAKTKELQIRKKKVDKDEKPALQRKIERREKRAEAIEDIIETYQDDNGDNTNKKRRKQKDSESQ